MPFGPKQPPLQEKKCLFHVRFNLQSNNGAVNLCTPLNDCILNIFLNIIQAKVC